MLPLKRRALLAALPFAILGARPARAQKPLAFGTATEGGSFMVYALAFVDAMRTVDPNLEIRSVPTTGTMENAPKLEAGELDIAMVSGEVAHELFDGVGRPPTKLKIVVAMYATPGMFAVRADSRYRSIDQLKGQPVVWNEKGSGIAVQASYMMSGLGLDLDKDFVAIYPNKRTDGPAMVLDGRAAALWGGGLRWPGFIEVANSVQGVRFIVPNVQEIKTILARHPFLRQVTTPAGLYRGQYDVLNTVGTWSYLLARADLDDEIGYRLAGDLYRIERAGSLSRLLVESTMRNTVASLPRADALQPGVMRFYKEKGVLP
jgi:TRAP transporter TAXI family solute receptor